MTKVTPEVHESTPMEVSADVTFAYNRFPKYKLGPTNQILENPPADSKAATLSDVVGRETVFLSDQHKRLSVRDLATKFDSALSSAVKLTEQAKINVKPSLEGHVLLKKLRDALEALRGRMVGKNKDDVEKAISMVEALAVKLTQKEGELIQDKFEVKKLAAFLKQASEDAKRLVNQERSFACAEIESARAVVQRFGEALEEEERKGGCTMEPLNVDALVEEVQEARRIKLKHQPSKVMDMEFELRALKAQIRSKSLFSVKLEKELLMKKRAEERKSSLYVLSGGEILGSCMQLHPQCKGAPPLSLCSFQWFRVSYETEAKEMISGADKSWYAPEPLDVGRLIQVEIASKEVKFVVSSVGVIEDDIGSYVDSLLRKSSAEFNVTVSKINGQDNSSSSVHVFNVGRGRIKLCRGWITKGREIYSGAMQIYGVRGEGNVATAARSLVWLPKKGDSYTLMFESERERNAAIVIARKYSLDCNVTLAGPDNRL